MDNPIYESDTKLLQRYVFTAYTGAIGMGLGFCYDNDYVTTETGETATDAWGGRGNQVNVASNTNNDSFAGVAAQAYTAKTGGQFIILNLVGSRCKVLTEETTLTLGDKNRLCCATGGYFNSLGAGVGKGNARILQTISAAGLVLVELLGGEESGLVEVLTPALAGGAITPMVGGKTFISGATVDTADITATLANGTYTGQRKYFEITATIGNSKDFILTVTSGIQIDRTSALATVTMDDDGDYCLLEWDGNVWALLSYSGATLA